jgi:hypothetical protein
LPQPAATSHAECAFTVVERGLTAEGRPDEFGTPTFPSRRFVSAGGLTVVHEGLLEYELVDIDGGPDGSAVGNPDGSAHGKPDGSADGKPDGSADGATGDAGPARPAARTLALTLLRATGMLSRLGMSTRPLPAGPMTPIGGPQMLGPVEVSYALATGADDPYALADDVLVPLIASASFGGGSRADRGSALTVRGAEVSAVTRRAGKVEVRVFNPTDRATRVELPGRSGWLVDLRGRPVSPFEGDFDLRGHGIATARLDGH